MKKLALLAAASFVLVASPQMALSKPSVLKIQPEGAQLAAMESGAQVVTSQMAGSTVVMRTPEPFDGKRTRIFFTFVNNGQFPVNVGPENVTSTQVAVISYDQLIAEQKRSEGVDKFFAAMGAVGKTLSATDAGNQSTSTSYSGYVDCGIGCGGTYRGSAVSSTYSPYAAQQARAQVAAENASAASEMHSGHASERNAIARNLQTTTVNPGHYITGMLTFEVPTAVRRGKKAVPISLAIRMGSDVHMLRGYAGPLGAAPPAISSVATSQITQPLASSIVPQTSSSSNVDEGGAEAQYTVGVSYAIGRGVAQDYATAVGYFRKAADKGYAQAQNYLGTMYENGRGVSLDEAIAADWYRKAADQGIAQAQLNLGVMYATGKGVTKDNATAVGYFRGAADQGIAQAQYYLGRVHHYGLGVAQDKLVAADWYRKAADQGYAQAQSSLDAMEANSGMQTKPNQVHSAAVAAIKRPASGDAFEDGYNHGLRLWEAKFYPESQATLAEIVAKFPKHKRVSYARNLLGRAWLDDKKPATAVKAFYDNYKNDPRGDRAPDSLFFLGCALTDLGKPAEAQEAFVELKRAYKAEVSGRLAPLLAEGCERRGLSKIAEPLVSNTVPPTAPANNQAQILNAGDLINGPDYPSGSRSRGEEGISAFELTLKNGRPASCKIISSSGFEELDEATCRLATERAVFDMSTLPKGNWSTYSNRVRWILSASAPRANSVNLSASQSVSRIDPNKIRCQYSDGYVGFVNAGNPCIQAASVPTQQANTDLMATISKAVLEGRCEDAKTVALISSRLDLADQAMRLCKPVAKQ